MKQFILCIVFFLALVLTSGTVKETYVYTGTDTPEYADPENSRQPEARTAENPCITVCIAANSYADVTVSQASGCGQNPVRRYRPAGFSFEKLFLYLAIEKCAVRGHSYKNALSDTQEYSALLKLDGYYIFALRKIII